MTQHNIYELEYLGAISIPFFTREDCISMLVELSDTHELTQALLVKGSARVQQHFLEATIDLSKVPYTAQKIEHLRAYVSGELKRITGDEVFEGDLSFTEVRHQRYGTGSVGIGPHLDSSTFRNLIVSIILRGDSSFYISKTREGEKRYIQGQEGSCIIMPAPGLFGKDIRILHSVEGIETVRDSLGLRQRKIG